MKLFEKKIKKVRSKDFISIVVLTIIALISLILAIINIIPKKKNYFEFNKNKETSKYVRSNIKYLMGPIMQSSNSKKEIFNYYIAEDEKEEFFIIKLTNNEKDIPILGKRLNKEDIEQQPIIEIRGINRQISSALKNVLINSLNNSMDIKDIDLPNISNFLGYYYFDATIEDEKMYKNFFSISAIFLLLDIIYILKSIKINKRITNELNKLEKDGELEKIIEDYEESNLIEYKKLKVIISSKYIISYLYDLVIIPIKKIKDVYVTKEVNGIKSRYKYIVIETDENLMYYITVLQNRKQKRAFEELLDKIKTIQR